MGSYVPGTTFSNPGGSTHVSPSGRTIPIVFVPGTMASRLMDPATGKLVWNPMAPPITGGRSPGRTAFGGSNFTGLGDSRLANVAAPLVPALDGEGYAPDAAIVTEDEMWRAEGNSSPVWDSIPGFFGPIPDYADHFLVITRRLLAEQLEPMQMTPKMFAFSYDWRQDNRLSAAHLHTFIANARAQCNDEKVFLVAHSMGNLVSRYYLKALGGEEAIRGLILLATPMIGAPQAYAYLKRGLVLEDGQEMYDLRTKAWLQTESQSIAFNRLMPSTYQLMPNLIYCKLNPHWLEFDPNHTGFPWVSQPGAVPIATPFDDCSDPYRLYEDLYTGFAESVGMRPLYAAYVEQAKLLHSALIVDGKAYIPENTHAIMCQNLDTPTLGALPAYGSVKANHGTNTYEPEPGGEHIVPLAISRDPSGDTSVPLWGVPPAEYLLRPFASEVFLVGGAAHTALPNDERTIEHAVELMVSMLEAESGDGGGGP